MNRINGEGGNHPRMLEGNAAPWLTTRLLGLLRPRRRLRIHSSRADHMPVPAPRSPSVAHRPAVCTANGSYRALTHHLGPNMRKPGPTTPLPGYGLEQAPRTLWNAELPIHLPTFRGRLSRCRGRCDSAGNDRGNCACSTVATRSPVAGPRCRKRCTEPARSCDGARSVRYRDEEDDVRWAVQYLTSASDAERLRNSFGLRYVCGGMDPSGALEFDQVRR